MPSVAARPWSSCAPTTEKKISVDSTPKLPPSTIGLPKSAIDSMKLIRNALARPGRISGSEMSTNVRQRSARSVCAASSSDGRHALDDADQHQEGDRREREHLRDQHALQAVDPARRLRCRMPIRANWLTRPERPKIRISPRPMTNGGVMIGSTDSMRSAFLKRKPVRVTISANARPSAVRRRSRTAPPGSACSTRRRSACWPAMQPSAQIFWREQPRPRTRRATGRRARPAAPVRRSPPPEERERGHEHADGDDAAGDERIALECATLGEAEWRTASRRP